MNQTIIKNWNSVVTPEDEVYVLGDLMLNDNAEGMRCLHQLNGTIHIIRGNHSSDERVNLYKSMYNVIFEGYATVLKYGGHRFYLSHYPTITANYDECEKPIGKLTVNLCGHCHTKDRWSDWGKGLIYHCELDAHDCTPVLLDDIIKEIDSRYAKERNLKNA